MKIFLPLLFFFQSFIVFSQQSSYVNYNVDNGLNSNEVYEILEDQQGNIWFATDKGVAKFNGYEFTRYTQKDGLHDNTILGLGKNEKGKIWFYSKSGRLSFFENDSFHIVLPNKDFGTILSFYVDTKDTIWISSRRHQYKVYPDENEKYAYKKLGRHLIFRKIDHSRKGVLLGTKNFEDTAFYSFDKTIESFVIPEGKKERLKFTSSNAFNVDSTTLWVGTRDHVFSFSRDLIKEVHLFDTPGKSIHFINTNDYFIGGTNGVCQWKNGKKRTINLLKNNRISDVLQDKEGGYWFSTLNSGVYYSSNLEVQAYNLNADKPIFNFRIDENGDLIALGKYGDQYREKENSFLKIHNDTTYDMFTLLNESNIYKLSLVLGCEVKKHWKNKSLYLVSPVDKENELWVAGSQVILIGKPHNQTHLLQNIPWRPTYAPIYRYHNEFYIPTSGGLFHFTSDKDLCYLGDRYQKLTQRVNDVCMDSQQRLWIATNNQGILLLDHEKLISIDSSGQSTGAICRRIICGPQYTWVSSERGLIRIDQKNHQNIERFTTRDGLLSNEIHRLFIHQGYLYLGHTTGITKFPLNFNKTLIPPIINFDNISIDHQKVALKHNYQLDYNPGPINITYTGISYNSDLTYQYRLNNTQDTSWTTTTDRSVQFLSLPHGEYTFEVRAFNEKGMMNAQPARLKFTVRAPFWSKWWFTLVTVLIIVGIVLIIFRYRYNQLNEKLDTKRKLILIEQQALRARMNPHFIFNSLNSVQRYIMENDKRRANKYLVGFSKLMRSILENSGYKLISIEKEVDVLKNYIQLEALRFKDKITYEIKLDAKLYGSNYKIPPLLLQPYVENAIYHGLLNKEEGGHIKISIEGSPYNIACSIEDNGVGREKALEIKKKKNTQHKSAGMQITANRIDLLQELYGDKFSLKIIDIKDNSNGIGTLVEITIPYLT